MSSTAEIEGTVETEGFAVLEEILPRAVVEHPLAALERLDGTGPVRKRGGIFAVRNLLNISPEVRELASSPTVQALVEPVLGHASSLCAASCSTRFLTRTGKFLGTMT